LEDEIHQTDFESMHTAYIHSAQWKKFHAPYEAAAPCACPCL